MSGGSGPSPSIPIGASGGAIERALDAVLPAQLASPLMLMHGALQGGWVWEYAPLRQHCLVPLLPAHFHREPWSARAHYMHLLRPRPQFQPALPHRALQPSLRSQDCVTGRLTMARMGALGCDGRLTQVTRRTLVPNAIHRGAVRRKARTEAVTAAAPPCAGMRSLRWARRAE
jgi:hypothetical protein